MKDAERWEQAAAGYAAAKGENRYSLFCRQFAQDYFTSVAGLRVLDAGCGDGEYTELFRQKGAAATGCDCSATIIAQARGAYPQCRFDVVDMKRGLPYAAGAFDFVFCHLVLMDVDPVDGIVQDFARVLQPGGCLFVSIVHPAFYPAEWEPASSAVPRAKRVSAYLSPASWQQQWNGSAVTHYHRPLSHYCNLLAGAGFHLRRMHEPAVYEKEKNPDIPLYLFFEATLAAE